MQYEVGTRLRCVSYASPSISGYLVGREATVFLSTQHGLGVQFDGYDYAPGDIHNISNFVWEVVQEPKPKGLVGFLRKHGA